jgi:hypothetical protein
MQVGECVPVSNATRHRGIPPNTNILQTLNAGRCHHNQLSSRLGPRVGQRPNEWIMLSRSQVLAASGQLFEARDEVLAFIAIEDVAENDAAK